jgi:hypothetical protein
LITLTTSREWVSLVSSHSETMRRGRVGVFLVAAVVSLICLQAGHGTKMRARHILRTLPPMDAERHSTSTEDIDRVNNRRAHLKNDLLRTPPMSSTRKHAVLLSPYLSATADVRGNLGPPKVVLSPKVRNWLSDRWQAAVDMSGKPIPGAHWVELKPTNASRSASVRFNVTHVLLDWETAHATDFVLQRRGADGGWHMLPCAPAQRIKARQHIVDTIVLKDEVSVTCIRLLIRRPGTQWGSSLWRFEIWGFFT